MTKVLALDLSLSTGYAILQGVELQQNPELLEWGTILAPDIDKSRSYPLNNLVRIENLAEKIIQLILRVNPAIIVVEQLNRGLNRHSQTILGFIHHAVLSKINQFYDILKVRYVDTSAWRKAVGLALTKEQKKSNLQLSQLKKQAKGDIKTLNKLKKKYSIPAKIDKKTIAIEMCNRLYDTKLGKTSDDAADAILQGLSFFKGVEFNYGK